MSCARKHQIRRFKHTLAPSPPWTTWGILTHGEMPHHPHCPFQFQTTARACVAGLCGYLDRLSLSLADESIPNSVQFCEGPTNQPANRRRTNDMIFVPHSVIIVLLYLAGARFSPPQAFISPYCTGRRRLSRSEPPPTVRGILFVPSRVASLKESPSWPGAPPPSVAGNDWRLGRGVRIGSRRLTVEDPRSRPRSAIIFV